MTYTLCLLALAAVFVIRTLRLAARRRREHTRERAERMGTEALPARDSADDAQPSRGLTTFLAFIGPNLPSPARDLCTTAELRGQIRTDECKEGVREPVRARLSPRIVGGWA